MPTFLLEIGVEEVPDWMIEPALIDLRSRFEAAFGSFTPSVITMDATPRRLVLVAKDMVTQAPDVESLVQGPYLSAGLKAVEGFARKQGVAIDSLAKLTDAKGERYIFTQLVKGQTASEALAAKLPEIISSIHFPKTMYWTGKNGVRFIRPIRWIVALLDDAVVSFEIAGVKSGNTTRGHRVLGSKTAVPVTVAGYAETLRANFVIVSAAERKQRIEAALADGVQKDESLVNSLVYLTEFPTPIRGSFDSSYLELPKEILSTVMRHHQRYFSLVNADGSLAPGFIAITNTDGDPDGLIRQGNERVLRARFNDARFFWQVDQQRKLRDRVDDLRKVTFQAKLGSYYEKTLRTRDIAVELAGLLHADVKAVEQAALLAKCDLTTDMVKEFTELQGAVGGLYAKAQGEGEAVAAAIYDHYKPVGMEDSIPSTLEGQIVSLADKLDTLRECFKVGLIPTGSKDPFALRRAAQGVVKILFDAKLPLSLTKYTADIPQLGPFLKERIEFYLRDICGFSYDEVAAVTVLPITTLEDLAERAVAIRAVRPTADFEPLAASFKRIKNILKQAQIDTSEPVDPKHLTHGPEQELYDAFTKVRAEAKEKASYTEKLALIATLRPYVDRFFDKILVNDTDPEIRRNRLALLHSLLTEFSTIADFSEIVTQGVSA